MDGKSEKHKYIGYSLANSVPINMTHQDIADRVKIGKNPNEKKSQSYISQMLRGRPASDETYIEVGRVIGLNEKQVRDIIFEGEKKKIQYEYPDKAVGFVLDKKTEELIEVTEDLTDSELLELKMYAGFLKTKR